MFHHFRSSIEEQRLHSEIFQLQSKLLDFNKKISPVKDRKQNCEQNVINHASYKPQRNLLIYLSSCINFIMIIIGSIAFIIWPLCFPAFVYLGEGVTLFFWQIAAVSFIVSIIMLIKMANEIYYFVKEGTQTFCRLCIQTCTGIINHTTFFITSANSKIQPCLWQKYINSTSDTISENKLYIITIFSLNFIVFALTYKNIFSSVYSYGLALISTGFLCGFCSSRTNNFRMHAERYGGVLPIVNCPEEAELFEKFLASPSYLQPLPSPGHLYISPLYHAPKYPSPPPTYQEAILDTGIRQSPACRMALFQ